MPSKRYDKETTMLSAIKQFLFHNTSTRQTVAKNTFWLAFGEIGSRLLRMVVVIYAARILGADGWGVFSYAITLAAFFTIFSDIGVSAILIREASRNPEKKDEYLSVSLFIKAILLFVSITIVIFIAPLFTKIGAALSLLPIAALIVMFDGLREFGFAMNRALEKMEYEAMVKLINNITITILGIAFLTWISATPKILAFSYLIGSAIGFIAMFWVIRKHLKRIFSSFNKKLILPILSAAWPFALTGFFGALMLNVDIIMLGWWRDAQEIGWYAADQRIIQILHVIPTFLSISLFPTLSRLSEGDQSKFRIVLEKALGLAYMVGIPIIVGGIILSKDIITLLFGQEYLPGTLTLQLLMTTLVFMFGSYLINNSIFAYNKQKKFIWLLGMGTITNIILNIILVPKYGIEGAAIATIISLSISYGIAWIVLKRINYFKLLPHIKNILMATTCMGIVTLLLKFLTIPLLLNILISGIIYFVILFIKKDPLLNEIKNALSF